MPIDPIDELDDPRLEDYRNVPDPVLLRKRGLFVAESRLVVRELLSHQRLNTRSVLAIYCTCRPESGTRCLLSPMSRLLML